MTASATIGPLAQPVSAATSANGQELDRTFVHHLSGKDTARPELAAMIAYIRDGDT